MSEGSANSLIAQIQQFSPKHEQFAVEVVKLLLTASRSAGVSDLHLIPDRNGAYQLCWRIDGVLHTVTRFKHSGVNLVTRLKVLSDLLTYRTDIPQEGRIRDASPGSEIRVSTFPTVHGEKAVVRLFAEGSRFQRLPDLGLPAEVCPQLNALLQHTAGAIVVSGPSGSGKTTTLYACLRTILDSASDAAADTLRAISTLEDPVECLIPGIAQTQIQAGRELTYARGLSSLMRQDPDVILVGEIRDHLTAETVFQAALTGHLILTSFHAGRAVEAVGRLLDMRIEPYILRSGLLGVLSQRLLRRLCICAQQDPESRFRKAVGCDRCGQTGYLGRMLLAELLLPDQFNLGGAIVDRIDTRNMARLVRQAGMVMLEDRIQQALDHGETSRDEVWRVFGSSISGKLDDESASTSP